MECEVPQFYSHSEPVARKRHKCCECRAPILPGEQHFRYSGKWEGCLSTGRQHYACMEACMLIRDEFENGECIGFGELKSTFADMRWQMNRTEKSVEKVRKLRSLMAAIIRRERKGE